MKPGKLTPAELSSYVFPHRGVDRADVLVRGAIGQDAAIVDFGPEAAVLSSDPITGAGHAAGWLAVHVGCNDVATVGARPVGVLVSLLLAPETAAEDARQLMADADRAASELGVEIVGGHSEVTAEVRRSIVVVTALGRVARDRYVTPAGASPGDTLLLSKFAGLEGTAILATDFAELLRDDLTPEALRRAQALLRQISVVPEALAAAGAGVSAMHDATEGGVIGALAELAAAAGVGVEVDLDAVPLLPETRAIAAAFGIDPFHLIASGALLLATRSPGRVIEAVRAIGCPIQTIGRVVGGPSVVRRGGETGPLVPPERDALWEALARAERKRRR